MLKMVAGNDHSSSDNPSITFNGNRRALEEPDKTMRSSSQVRSYVENLLDQYDGDINSTRQHISWARSEAWQAYIKAGEAIQEIDNEMETLDLIESQAKGGTHDR